ncbi:MAG: RNA methyltransferase [Bacteroidales bacterium]|nr:RNA methyltransferase [Bacteroidales bacterium]
MLSRNSIHEIRSLKDAKNRNKTKQFVAEGPKVINELLLGSFEPKGIYCLEDALFLFKNKVADKDVIKIISEKELQRISQLVTPNKALAVFNMATPVALTDFETNDPILMLDDISDPGNLGTIIRTADWFGVKHIICSEKSVDVYNPKVVQSTMGSLGRVQVHYLNIAEFLSVLPKAIPCYGAFPDGESIYDTSFKRGSILLIGSESHGISKDLLPFVTKKISIPGFSKNEIKAESLNASIAAAIICAELRRQLLIN